MVNCCFFPPLQFDVWRDNSNIGFRFSEELHFWCHRPQLTSGSADPAKGWAWDPFVSHFVVHQNQKWSNSCWSFDVECTERNLHSWCEFETVSLRLFCKGCQLRPRNLAESFLAGSAEDWSSCCRLVKTCFRGRQAHGSTLPTLCLTKPRVILPVYVANLIWLDVATAFRADVREAEVNPAAFPFLYWAADFFRWTWGFCGHSTERARLRICQPNSNIHKSASENGRFATYNAAVCMSISQRTHQWPPRNPRAFHTTMVRYWVPLKR